LDLNPHLHFFISQSQAPTSVLQEEQASDPDDFEMSPIQLCGNKNRTSHGFSKEESSSHPLDPSPLSCSTTVCSWINLCPHLAHLKGALEVAEENN
jgi:hypothetical protein